MKFTYFLQKFPQEAQLNHELYIFSKTNKKYFKKLIKISSKSDMEIRNYDKLIKNYGIGAQIIRSIGIKNMILVSRSKKKVVGLDGYGIKIKRQEIIK